MVRELARFLSLRLLDYQHEIYASEEWFAKLTSEDIKKVKDFLEFIKKNNEDSQGRRIDVVVLAVGSTVNKKPGEIMPDDIDLVVIYDGYKKADEYRTSAMEGLKVKVREYCKGRGVIDEEGPSGYYGDDYKFILERSGRGEDIPFHIIIDAASPHNTIQERLDHEITSNYPKWKSVVLYKP